MLKLIDGKTELIRLSDVLEILAINKIAEVTEMILELNNKHNL
jgi:hypothetical protein